MTHFEIPPEARTLALEVRALFTQGNNRKVWQEQIREFMRRGAEHVAAMRRANARANRADTAAFKRIRQERLAVEEGKARPRLTGDKSPGKGWGLGFAHGGEYLSEFGWLPPRVYAQRPHDTKNPWPADGSPPAMFTLLAALHDICLVPSVKPILPVHVSIPDGAARIEDLGVWALRLADSCVWGGMREDKGFLATLQAYLIDVRAFLMQSETKAAQTGRPTQPTIGTVTGDGSMDDLKKVARTVRRFLLRRLGRDRLKAACRKAERESDEWGAACHREQQAEREAVRAIHEERQRGGGPLTNDNKRPGDGWQWATREHWVAPGLVSVEGWIPPRVVKWLDTRREWPPKDPSFDTMVAALAAFHDVALPETPPLLDDPEADAEGCGAWFLRRAFKTYFSVCEMAEAQIDARGLDLARAYLDCVKAALHSQASGPAAKAAAVGKGIEGASELPAKPVAKRYKLAFESYLWACEKRPDLTRKDRYPETLYDYAKNNWTGYADTAEASRRVSAQDAERDTDTSAEAACPSYETWTRYIREYERLKNGPGNTPRAVRPLGRSIVRHKEM